MRKIDLTRWEAYFELRNSGNSIEHSARGAKIDPHTAHRFERGEPGSTGLAAAEELGVTVVGGEAVAPDPPADAVKALNDFGLFRRRYFGRKATPWQERAAYEVQKRLETPDREYGVINCPPGSGKSTLFTHDIPCWLIARNRSIRVLLGSGTGRQSRLYVGRVKRTLEREVPVSPDSEQHKLGLAEFATATMAGDYGAFKPPGRTDLWRSEALVVRQYGGYTLEDKEPTVSAFGADERFLGGRYDFVVWDDLVDKRNMKGESADALAETWSNEFETRLEPGGLLILQGQRMAPEDLYRYCLDLTDLDSNKKYFHVIYPAHDETRCKGQHNTNAATWPNGCLLDPRRIPWKMLSEIQANNPKTFEVQYQQKDGTASGELVEMAWLKGGIDSRGVQREGCYDHERLFGQTSIEARKGWSVLSIDPSPSNFWGIIWWVMDPDNATYEIIEGYRRKMGSEDLLSEDMNSKELSGLAEDIRIRSHQIGHPLQAVVIEINAAQKYLMQQPHVQRWSRLHDIDLIPHLTSHITKNSSELNVTSIADFFRQGKVRIPHGDLESRQFSNIYSRELVTWPDGQTDDLVMSTWFALRAVQLTYIDPNKTPPKFERPGFIRKRRGTVTRPETMEDTLPYNVRTPTHA